MNTETTPQECCSVSPICGKNNCIQGRYLNDTDIKQRKRLLLRLVARDLFGEEDPIGKFVDIGKTVFKVVGVFKDSGGDKQERFAYIPILQDKKWKKQKKKLVQL